MDELTTIGTQLVGYGIERVERIDDPAGTWSYLRKRLGRKQTVTLSHEQSGGTYVVKSLRQGMCADVYTDDLARGLDTAAAVETFARFVAEAPRHRG